MLSRRLIFSGDYRLGQNLKDEIEAFILFAMIALTKLYLGYAKSLAILCNHDVSGRDRSGNKSSPLPRFLRKVRELRKIQLELKKRRPKSQKEKLRSRLKEVEQDIDAIVTAELQPSLFEVEAG